MGREELIQTNLRSKLAEKVKKAEKGQKRGTPHVL
jgi:hypothetical protein